MVRRKARLLILECTKSSEEKRSEGKLLHELMNVLGFGQFAELRYISGKDDFRFKIQEFHKDVDAPTYLHVSAHGAYCMHAACMRSNGRTLPFSQHSTTDYY